MIMQKGKKFAGITENLNRILTKSLENFSQNTEWTDINNWLLTLESVLKDYPSPFITQKILLSKRLNQCMNPILPDKIHECVLRIHDIIFSNMKIAADGNINDYIKMFAEDLGTYSISILPYFTHTSVRQHRLIILKIIKDYYLDLGRQLIPMLSGFAKSLLPVYTEVTDQKLSSEIQRTLDLLLVKAGRRYMIGSIWSSILKFTDCKQAGMKYLSRTLKKMDFIKDQEDFSQSHGFSQQEEELRLELLELEKQQANKKVTKDIRGSVQDHLVDPRQLDTPIQDLSDNKIDPFLQKDKVHEFDENQREEVNSQQDLNQKQNADLFEANKDQFLKGIREVQNQNEDENQNQKNEQETSNKQIREKKLLKAQTTNFFDYQLNAPETPHSVSQQAYLMSTKMFSTSQQFQSSDTIRLNKVPLVTTPGIQVIKEGIDSDRQENNYPNSNTLVVSALISCLEQDSQLIKRAALDFMFSHLRIKSQILEQNDRKLLVEALVGLFKRKEISICKRVNRWLFGKEDEQNRYKISEKNHFVIEYIINAFHKILQKEPTSEENCSIPIKILQNFYIEHPHLVQLTLGQISISVLRYIFNFGTKSEKHLHEDSQGFSEQVMKAGKRFLQNLPSYYPIIFKSLGRAYLEAIQNRDSQLCYQAVKYTDFCYINLMKHEHGLEELQYITLTLQALCSGLRVLSEQNSYNQIFLKDAILLVYNLVARRDSVQRYNKKATQKVNQKYFEETGQHQLPPERVQYQRELQQQEENQQNRYTQIQQNLQTFFVGLGNFIKAIPNIQMYEQCFKISSMAIVKIQGHLPKKGINQLPGWFATIQQGIKLSNPVVSLASIEAMIKILMWEQQHPIYNSLKLIIVQQKSKKIGNDYQKLALQKLWALLDFPHMHSKIIDLIISFSRFFPYQFTQTVKRSFTKINTAQKQASIQRFSHFWRLTGFKYKQLLVSNRQFGQLNKVGLFMMLDFLDDPNPLVRHAAKNWLMESIPLFNRIIQPLLNQLVKNCTDWYQTPKGISLIKNVYDTDHVFSTIRRIRSILSNGSFAVLRYLYQTQISQNLDELKDKVTDLKEPFLTLNSKQTPKLTQSLIERQPVLPKSLQKHLDTIHNAEKKASRMAYFDLMLILIIKYVQGHAIESMGVEFYVGNSGVNASAVQFLETLLDYIDNPGLCHRIINYILNPLFKVLKQVVINREYIMQIQILNILKNIFFSSSFRKKADSQEIRQFFKLVFTNKTFIGSTLQGLNTPFSYVRSQFISFLTICIPLIADFLEPNDCTQCIRNIIFNYYRIIKDLRVNVLADVLKDQTQVQQDIYHVNKKQHSLLYSRVVQLQQNIRKQEKFVKMTNNLSQIAKTNEVLSILHGISAILNYFFDLNKLNLEELNFQFTNPYTFFDTFKSIITLGMASSLKEGKLVERKQFLHNFETCQAILDDLSPVYETILRSWSLSEEYVRISTQEFSSVGMKFFNFQKFQSYNRIVKQLIIYVQEQKESIWGKIFSIMQPMYYRFPKEITDIYLKLWQRQCEDVPDPDGKIKANSEKTEFLMKIIETIIVNNFPMHIVIHAFLQSTAMQQLNEHYKNLNSNKKGNVLNFQINKKQSKLLFFVYVYLNYVHINEKQMTSQKLLQIWSLIMKILKPFQKSRSPIVAIWILEIINLCSKKYSPKELLINQKFKSDLHRLINEKLKFIASVASRTQKFFFRDPMMKINFNQQQETSTIQYHIVLPLPPTIYEIHKTKSKQRNNTDKEMIKSIRPGDNMELQNKYRLYCFKVLKKLGLQILQNTYLPEKTHWVVVRTNEWLDIILPVIEDKNTHNMIFAECASEILHDILNRARILFIKTLKPKVLQIFNKDDFFICNPNTLNFWSNIIDWIVSMDRYNETFSQYLEKVSLSSSYFASQNLENKKRIKSFERICFILYSGSKDKYALKIKGLLQKIADVIKMSESAHPALLILILFCIRILILKLSEISLNQLFIDIWPMILALLMQIFSKQYVKVNLQNQVSKNPNLLLASLKLIEMISLTNLGEFAHHQWIFIYDYFGIKLTVPELTHELNEFYSSRRECNFFFIEVASIIKVNKTIKTTPFIYKPYLSNYTPVNSINYSNQRNQEQKIGFAPIKRNIVIKNSFVQDENELKIQVLVLMQYLNFVGQYRTFVDWQEVQNVIVDDFIKLDSFIHEIK